MRLDNGQPVKENTLRFVFTDAAHILVTNRLDGEIATGITGTVSRAVTLVLIPVIPIGFMLYRKRKRKVES